MLTLFNSHIDSIGHVLITNTRFSRETSLWTDKHAIRLNATSTASEGMITHFFTTSEVYKIEH